MDKKTAIDLLGGTVSAAAQAIGITYHAVGKWPDPLPPRIADRVVACIARKKLRPEEIGGEVPADGGADGALAPSSTVVAPAHG